VNPLPSSLKAVGGEAVVVALAVVLLALAANALSPRGIRLDRDYFPTPAPAAAPAVGPASPAARLAQRGLRVASASEVAGWLREERRMPGQIVFIDARRRASYTAAHIPGAWQFDHYRPEVGLPEVLPACLAALKVVVYCTGAECDDSEHAALLLRDAGVPGDRLHVFVGGLAEWTALGLPVETGERNSGQVQPSRS
jgi:rhodanese-related sulfurtransferase